MKLLFSEQNSDYEHYQFPYAIWAMPEDGETPADIFNAGFLPSSRNLDRFYLCRQVRVNLAKFMPSSENRRILRKGAGIEVKLVAREKFDYTPERRTFFKTYADIKFGKQHFTNRTHAHPSDGLPRARAFQDIPDNIVNQLIEKRLKQSDCRVNGWVLEGFPYTKG